MLGLKLLPFLEVVACIYSLIQTRINSSNYGSILYKSLLNKIQMEFKFSE